DVDPEEDGRRRGGRARARRRSGTGGGFLPPRFKLYLLGGAMFAGIVGIIVALAWWNSRDYFLTCESDALLPQRGSSWLWGRTTLQGDAYRPLKLSPDAECEPRELDSE